MNADEQRSIAEEVTKLLSTDYRLDFEPIFERAAQVMNAIPLRASEEIRIVQTHCSNAVTSDNFGQGDLEIARARRHLQQAKYECLLVMTTRQSEVISSYALEVDVKDPSQRETVKAAFHAAEYDFKRLPKLRSVARTSRNEILQDIESAIQVNIQLEEHLTRLNSFIEAIRDRDKELLTEERIANELIEKRESDSQPKLLHGKSRGEKRQKTSIGLQTRVGRKFFRNRIEIVLAIPPVLVLIEQKIDALRAYLPNHPDEQRKRDDELRQYETLKSQLAALQEVAERLQQGSVEEDEVVKKSLSFAEGVLEWWTKHYDEICASAFNTGVRAFEATVFVGCVSVCSLTGIASPLTTALTAALIGGKPIIAALKSLPRIFGRSSS